VTIGGAAFDLYRGQNGSTNVFSFVRTANATTAVLDMTSFTGELVGATDDAVTVAADTGVVSIAYADIHRSNLLGD